MQDSIAKATLAENRVFSTANHFLLTMSGVMASTVLITVLAP